jgi:ABC-type bacteriocin/lantibiotic exporter with double-glycine peptidase domain
MLACLRMILAHRGTVLTEAALLQEILLQEGGVDPQQLADLAQRHGIRAEARQLDLRAIITLVEHEQFPITLIERSFLDGEFAVHAVIPIRFSRLYVTLLDPLRGDRRVSIRKFEMAQRRVGGWAVVFVPTGTR